MEETMRGRRWLVRDVMTTNVVVVHSDDFVRDAAATLAQQGIGGAPVVDAAGKVLGVITRTEIMKALGKAMHGFYTEEEIGYGLLLLAGTRSAPMEEVCRQIGVARVRDFMRERFPAVDPEEPLETVFGAMAQEDADRILVMRGGRVMGIVTRTDVLRHLAEA